MSEKSAQDFDPENPHKGLAYPSPGGITPKDYVDTAADRALKAESVEASVTDRFLKRAKKLGVPLNLEGEEASRFARKTLDAAAPFAAAEVAARVKYNGKRDKRYSASLDLLNRTGHGNREPRQNIVQPLIINIQGPLPWEKKPEVVEGEVLQEGEKK